MAGEDPPTVPPIGANAEAEAMAAAGTLLIQLLQQLTQQANANNNNLINQGPGTGKLSALDQRTLLDFDALDDTNYLFWKDRMRTALDEMGLWGIVNGTEETPDEYDPEYKNWARREKAAFSRLQLKVSKTVAPKIRSCTTSSDIWKKLESHYRLAGSLGQFDLMARWNGCKCNKEEIRDYIAKHENFAAEAEEYGMAVDDALKAMMFLQGLPTSYAHVVSAINTAATERGRPVSFQKATTAALAEYTLRQTMRVKSTHHTGIKRELDVEPEDTVYATLGRDTTKWRISRREAVCHACGKEGHYTHECFSLPENARNRKARRFPTRNQDSRANTVSTTSSEQGHDMVQAAFSHDTPILPGPDSEYVLFAFDYANITVDPEVWLVDSGCSNHICGEKDMFESYEICMGLKSIYVTVGNGEQVAVHGKGTIRLQANGSKTNIVLKDVYHIPKFPNLISVGQPSRKGVVYRGSHEQMEFSMVDQPDKVIMTAVPHGKNLFRLDVSTRLCPNDDRIYAAPLSPVAINRIEALHRQLGHPSFVYMREMAKAELLPGLKASDFDKLGVNSACVTCTRGKLHRSPFNPSNSRAATILQLVHSDVVGKLTPSMSGCEYFVTFLDDASRYSWTYAIKKKSDVESVFKRWKESVENFTKSKITILRSDGGGEYVSNSFIKFLHANGIRHQMSITETPQQNGRAKRFNRTIQNKVNCLMIDSGFPEGYWAESLHTATYLLNRTPNKAIGKTPYEAFHGKKPDLSNLQTFGAKGEALILPLPAGNKGKSRTVPVRFLGYSEDRKAYRCVTDKGAVIFTRDVKFFPTDDQGATNYKQAIFPSKQYGPMETLQEELDDPGETASQVSGQKSNNSPDAETQGEPVEGDSEDIQVKTNTSPPADSTNKELPPTPPSEETSSAAMSTNDATCRGGMGADGVYRSAAGRPIKPPTSLDPNSNNPTQGLLAENIGMSIDPTRAPSCYEEAMAIPGFVDAMEREMASLRNHGVYETVSIPPGRKPIGGKWVYAVKQRADGSIEKYKARFVGQGFSQIPGTDYETDGVTAPTARQASTRLFLAVSSKHKFSIRQADFETAYLNADMDKELYMKPPKGYEEPDGKCWLIKKALYGFKQSGNLWHLGLTKTLSDTGFTKLQKEPCWWVKKENGAISAMALIYVDDILVATESDDKSRQILLLLNAKYQLKDRGALGESDAMWLGMQIKRCKSGYDIDQSHYARTIVDRLVPDARGASTPITKELSSAFVGQEPRVNQSIMVASGSIIWLACGSRPDLSFAGSTIAQHNAHPTEAAWGLVTQCVRYIKSTAQTTLHIEHDPQAPPLELYCDADYAEDKDTRRSISGYVIKVHGSTIAWQSKKQKSIVRSTLEAEYVAASLACQQLQFYQQLLREVDVHAETPPVWIDNMGAIETIKNQYINERTKHIDISLKYAREMHNKGTIDLRWIPSKDQQADLLTKALPGPAYATLNKALGLHLANNTTTER